jgi:NAD(P)-dependent dehydrogenase (short-subunit alcohol dehydrogenase family)
MQTPVTGLPSFDLTGKVAVVTGASRGIGESIAKALAAHHAHVVVTSRKLEGCQAVVEQIRAAGGSAEAMACHIGDLAAIDELLSAVEQKHGKLDILVNNAATNPHFGPIYETDVGAFQKTVDVNIRGFFFMTQGAVKRMAPRKQGAIVNVASINGFIPGALQGIYSVTKAAILSMTHAYAKECGPLGIRVNAIAPGITDTKFASALVKNDTIREKATERTPIGRVAHPDEMAGAVLYLVSPASSYTTGTCITVDGGFLIG